ncbi:Hpt domain-containing protein [Roseovarius pacificus]|uniref:Hpt domain-containing protein n=1 Tax=Roseovarius pacificus TaxID=337701 RepID=UPI002A18749E|nr:Hpt domain-containing protein [Roseovarius pacificus]
MSHNVQVNQKQTIGGAIAALRIKFVESLEERILDIEALLQCCRTAETRSRAFQEITRKAHNLAGVAPSLGFDAIGDAAREAETIADDASADDAAVVQKVEVLLDEMEAQLDKAAV